MNSDNDIESLVWQRAGGADNTPVVNAVTRLIKANEKERLVAALDRWHPADQVELFVNLPLKYARKLFDWMPAGPAAKVLAELSPDFRAALMEDAAITRMAELLDSLEPEDVIELESAARLAIASGIYLV